MLSGSQTIGECGKVHHKKKTRDLSAADKEKRIAYYIYRQQERKARMRIMPFC